MRLVWFSARRRPGPKPSARAKSKLSSVFKFQVLVQSFKTYILPYEESNAHSRSRTFKFQSTNPPKFQVSLTHKIGLGLLPPMLHNVIAVVCRIATATAMNVVKFSSTPSRAQTSSQVEQHIHALSLASGPVRRQPVLCGPLGPVPVTGDPPHVGCRHSES